MRAFEIIIEKTLYHGTSRSRATSIMKDRHLIPGIGDFVSQMYDEEPDMEDLVFAADKQEISKAITAMISAIEHDLGKGFHDITEDEIQKFGAIVVIKSGDDYFDHREEDDENYWGEHPSTVEPGDYFSRDYQGVDYVLTGKKMIRFLKKMDLWPINYPFFKAPKANRELLIKKSIKRYGDDMRQQIIAKINTLDDSEVIKYLKA